MIYSKQSFEQLFKGNYQQMYRLAFCLLEDAEDARDAVSQVFALLWQNKPQLKEDAATSYLLIATRNQCLHVLRNRSRQLELQEELKRELRHPDKDRAQEELIREVLSVIGRHLTEQDRRVLQLHFGEDMTYKEAAQVLGISPSAINKHITQSLAKLREIFKHQK